MAYGSEFVLPTTTREGYTFLGWDIDGDGQVDELPETMPAHNMSATAQWAINTYTITFVTSNGTVIAPITGEYGSEITTIIEEPTRLGFTFVRWDKEIPATMPAEDVVITAQWKVNQYTITYVVDGVETVVTYDYNGQVTMPETPTKDKYTFVGWDKEIPATMPAENIVITAKFVYSNTGWVIDDKGTTYEIDGETAYVSTWQTIDEVLYYFDEEGYVVKGLYEVYSNGELEGTYVFDEVTGEFRSDLNGLYVNNNETYYLQDGIVIPGLGLMRIETTDGVFYYYFAEDGKAVKNTSMEFTTDTLNGYALPEDTYTFGEDGTIVHDEDTSKNGIYLDKGVRYYYIDGIKVYAGLIEIDGDYYYVGKGGKVVCGQLYFVDERTNDLLPRGYYQFNAVGKMVVSADINRVYGDSRYETAYGIADQLKLTLGIEKFNTVVIATGTSYPDALTGSYLANKLNAPILLINERYFETTVQYVKDNLVDGGKVYILGGEKAVPATLEAALTGYDVERLAGADRFETNLLILEEAGISGNEILVSTGYEFADSLSASATGKPIMLVHPTNGLSDAQIEFLNGLNNVKLYVIGGEKAVSAETADKLSQYGTVERIGGATRCETSVLIAEKFFNEVEYAVIATAWNFPDGLAGGTLAYAYRGPIILTSSAEKDYGYAKEYMSENIIKNGFVIGGNGIITDEATRIIFNVNSSTEIKVSKYE